MANKTIAIVDINNAHKQNIETLLFACILEKKVNKLTVLDLNLYEKKSLLPERDEWKKESEILTTTLFSNTSYQICASLSQTQNKLLNLASALQAISDILLLNMNSQDHKSNTQFYELADEIVIFADLERNITNNIINFFLKHNLKGKPIHLIVHNYKLNMQSEKTYLHLLKQFKQNNIFIKNIDTVPDFASLNDLENIDPWLDIYKLIKKTW